jgi:hypothetical protein
MQKEIKGMLDIGITYPINKSKWNNHMVVQLKKHNPKKLRIYVDFRGLNKLTLTNDFLTPFTYEIINEVAGHECYSFVNGFFGYN